MRRTTSAGRTGGRRGRAGRPPYGLSVTLRMHTKDRQHECGSSGRAWLGRSERNRGGGRRRKRARGGDAPGPASAVERAGALLAAEEREEGHGRAGSKGARTRVEASWLLSPSVDCRAREGRRGRGWSEGDPASGLRASVARLAQPYSACRGWTRAWEERGERAVSRPSSLGLHRLAISLAALDETWDERHRLVNGLYTRSRSIVCLQMPLLSLSLPLASDPPRRSSPAPRLEARPRATLATTTTSTT